MAGFLVAAAVALDAQRARGAGDDVWNLLAGKYDKNQDGRITPAEYPREANKFEAFDRDGDGSITRADFAAGRRRARPRRPGGGDRLLRIGGMLAVAADLDRSGDVTAAEWKAFLSSVQGERRGRVDEAKLVAAVTRDLKGAAARWRGRAVARGLDRDRNGTIEAAELNAAFSKVDKNGDGAVGTSELPRRRSRARVRLPRRGDPAPDFELPFSSNPKKTVKLSSFAGKRPVALIFGSYT
jgi:Ca2+-binding EF-hand superfamily protein